MRTKTYPTDVTDGQWQLIAPLLPLALQASITAVTFPCGFSRRNCSTNSVFPWFLRVFFATPQSPGSNFGKSSP